MRRHSKDYILKLIEGCGFVLQPSDYVSVDHNLALVCKNHHQFKRTFSKLQKGYTKCPKCKLDKTELIKNFCKQKGYEFLKTEKNLVHILCKNGHKLSKTYSSLRDKPHQCRVCAGIDTGNRGKHSLKYISDYISKSGELLLSKEYKNSDQLLEVRCNKLHDYTIRFNNYTKGHRCPMCFYKKETVCREIIENLTGKKFPKKRPDFLKYKNNKNLELDGFNAELKVAFEYDGEQHFLPSVNWGGQARLKEQKKKDKFKDKQCKKYGIFLIRIAYFIKNKEEFIKEELKKLDLIE